MVTNDQEPVARHERVLWAVQTCVMLYGIWFALDGPGSPLTGLVFAVAGAATGAWLAPGVPYPWRPLRLLAFTAWFLRKFLAGALDVARRALAPSLPIQPCWQEYRLRLGPGLPRTALVSVISLVPGTLSVELEPERDVLIVHRLFPGSTDDLDDLETRIAWLFSVPLKAPG
ncbi:MAG: Na+/H+ antiporter subunit E [Chromatiales bacterium]|nr:Na+/H+ antiporter subunit E [Chromatiales bacterium]